MASRILGMGDILSLIEKAEMDMDSEKAKKLSQKIAKADFDFNDFLEQLEQVEKMGGMASILTMLPGIGGKVGLPDVDDRQMVKIKAIIQSMSEKERLDPSLLNPSRKNRIAKGSGVNIAEVNRLVKQFEQMKKMMKQFPGMMKNNKKRGAFGGLFGGKLGF